jgi:hypothetical protein
VPSLQPPLDDRTKARIVSLILSGRTEEALQLLSSIFNVEVPAVRVGHFKGHKKVLAVYVAKKKSILVASSDGMWNPFVIIHEFYHHLRSRTGEHRGNERLADNFSLEFIRSYRRLNPSGDPNAPS